MPRRPSPSICWEIGPGCKALVEKASFCHCVQIPNEFGFRTLNALSCPWKVFLELKLLSTAYWFLAYDASLLLVKLLSFPFYPYLNYHKKGELRGLNIMHCVHCLYLIAYRERKRSGIYVLNIFVYVCHLSFVLRQIVSL